MKNVDVFLERFHLSKDIDDVFTHSACYWFSQILYCRFASNNPKIMYARVDNHFGTMIGNKVYDITGDVTDSYDWMPWDELDDELERGRVVRDCIMF